MIQSDPFCTDSHKASQTRENIESGTDTHNRQTTDVLVITDYRQMEETGRKKFTFALALGQINLRESRCFYSLM